MAYWLQNLLVFLIVGGCFGVIAAQAVRSLRGKKSKLGSCCARGCDIAEKMAEPHKQTQRVVFFPSEMLTSSRRSSRR